ARASPRAPARDRPARAARAPPPRRPPPGGAPRAPAPAPTPRLARAAGPRRGSSLERGARRRAREPRLQAQHRLRVQLRDARLGHAEHFADLAQGQLLVVVERDDELLA